MNRLPSLFHTMKLFKTGRSLRTVALFSVALALATLGLTGRVSAETYDFSFTGSVGDLSGELSGYQSTGFFQATSGSGTISTGAFAGDDISLVPVTASAPGFLGSDDKLFPTGGSNSELDFDGLLFSVDGLAPPELFNLYSIPGYISYEYTSSNSSASGTFTLTQPAPEGSTLTSFVIVLLLFCGLIVISRRHNLLNAHCVMLPSSPD